MNGHPHFCPSYLVLAQQAQIDRLMAEVTRLSARVRELEAKLNVPPKTPDNSSLPPSKGQKPDLPKERKKRRYSHPGVARALAENPDRIIDARLTACPHCAHALGAADQSDIHAYPIFITKSIIICNETA